MPRGGFAPLKVRHRNWDGTENPFQLAQPPASFLTWLQEYDAELLVMPGLSDAVYRLARRSQSSQKLKPFVKVGESETRRMIRVGAVPVISIARSPDWEGVKRWVVQADQWAAGGSEKFADKLEENERVVAAKAQAAADDESMQRAISGWHGWQFRTGQAAFVQGAPRTTSEEGQPSGLHARPDRVGDFANGSLPSESCPGETASARGVAQAQDSAHAEDAVLVPRTAQGQP